MEEGIKLSIVMRTLNRLEYTIRSIVSIDQHCGINKNFYEIICVDQGSTDGTREWLRSVKNEGYYPVRPVFLHENIGDGPGMQEGIKYARGEFIAQHDNDILLSSGRYYYKLICIYEQLEKFGFNVCAVGGSHRQGINKQSSPMKFGMERYPRSSDVFPIALDGPGQKRNMRLFLSAWITASFIFRKKFISHPFDKRMCNSWCGYWWDKGYDNFLAEDVKFWHIDSGTTGAHIQKQYNKFPSYRYAFTHYRNFIDTGESREN